MPRYQYPDYSFDRKPSLAKIERIMALLGELDHTSAQLARKMHTTQRTLHKYLAHLHDQGRVHVVDWHQGAAGAAAPIYRAGPGKDKPKPRPLTAQEYNRRHHLKLMADIERHDREKARRRRWWHEMGGRKKTKQVKPDQAAAWLFNPIPANTHQPKEGTAP